jgi:hypothetical protein
MAPIFRPCSAIFLPNSSMISSSSRAPVEGCERRYHRSPMGGVKAGAPSLKRKVDRGLERKAPAHLWREVRV